MLAVTIFFTMVSLAGSYLLYFTAPRLGPGHAYGLPFRHIRSSPGIWRKSHRFAGICLFLSSFFLAVPPFIWGTGSAVQAFLLIIWSLALLPLLALTVYAYTLLLLLKEEQKP